MSWIAVAIGGGALIGAIGSNMAAGTQADAQQHAADTQLGMFNTINAQENPFVQSGYASQFALNQLMGLGPPAYNPANANPGAFAPGSVGTPGGSGAAGNANLASMPGGSLPYGFLSQTFNPTQDQLESYPGYQFQLEQGGQAVRNASTPGSGALSGAALKSLMGFNQGLAASNYSNYFNQFQQQQTNIFNRLSSIADLGQSAASNVGNAGTQLGTGAAGAQAAAGGSQAAGIVGASNSISGAGIPLAYLYGQQGNNGFTGENSPYQGAGDDQSFYMGSSRGS